MKNAWDDGWVYVEDKLPPFPKRAMPPYLITYEGRKGKRRTTAAIWTGTEWKFILGRFHKSNPERVIAWRLLPNPALGKMPKFLKRY